MDCYPLTCGQIVQHPIVSRTMHALHTIVEIVGGEKPHSFLLRLIVQTLHFT